MSQVVEGIDFLRKHMNEANTDPEVLEAMELLREETACEAQVTQRLRDLREPNDQPAIECDEKKMLESREQVNSDECIIECDKWAFYSVRCRYGVASKSVFAGDRLRRLRRRRADPGQRRLREHLEFSGKKELLSRVWLTTGKNERHPLGPSLR